MICCEKLKNVLILNNRFSYLERMSIESSGSERYDTREFRRSRPSQPIDRSIAFMSVSGLIFAIIYIT
ncbi:hypothetical protein CKA32_000850 [Geitlerinema sp. FC II]|nr:hypothetical protein CKA32_000850 [Geitlerinema sp. FC II]